MKIIILLDYKNRDSNGLFLSAKPFFSNKYLNIKKETI